MGGDSTALWTIRGRLAFPVIRSRRFPCTWGTSYHCQARRGTRPGRSSRMFAPARHVLGRRSRLTIACNCLSLQVTPLHGERHISEALIRSRRATTQVEAAASTSARHRSVCLLAACVFKWKFAYASAILRWPSSQSRARVFWRSSSSTRKRLDWSAVITRAHISVGWW